MGRFSGLFSTLVGLAAVALAVWFLRRPDPPPAPEEGQRPFVLPVTLGAVTQDTLRPSVQLTGTVRSPARGRYGFEVAGQLTQLLVREVDSFEAGDVLARLDDTDERLAMAEATVSLALSLKELAKLEAGTRAEELERLRAEHAELIAMAALAQSDVERFQPLVADRVRSQAELEQLEALRDAANARAAGKAAALAEAEAGARDEDLAIAQAKVDQAQARLNVSEAALAKTALVARTAGIVLERLATVGDHVAVGTPVLEVLDPSQLEIAVEVPGRYVALLDNRPEVRLLADDLPGWSLVARLDATIPAADERSRNFTGLVRFDRISDGAGAGDLQPGMFVRVDLELRALPDALLVSPDAIRQTARGPELVRALFGPPGPGGHPSVTAQVLAVKVLAAAGERVAVSAPDADPQLAAGDAIVLTGVDSAFTGAALKPAPDPAAEGGGAKGAGAKDGGAEGGGR